VVRGHLGHCSSPSRSAAYAVSSGRGLFLRGKAGLSLPEHSSLEERAWPAFNHGGANTDELAGAVIEERTRRRGVAPQRTIRTNCLLKLSEMR